MPQFSSDFNERRFCLSPDGLHALARVLTAIAIEYPGCRSRRAHVKGQLRADVTFCPWLPYVACLCLHWMSEDRVRHLMFLGLVSPPAQVFACCAAMLSSHQVLYTTRLETWSMLEAFRDLVQECLPKAHVSLLTTNTSGSSVSISGAMHA